MFNTDIPSTSELLSIALATAREFIRLYSELAISMRGHGNPEASAAFETLIDDVRQHQHRLGEWAELEGLGIDPEATPINWDDPGVATHFDDEARDPYRCTPYKAFAFAAHNEERAFHYFTYVAADSRNSEVRQRAKVLAHSALDRAASLKVLRRRAWHEQEAELSESIINPGVIHGVPDLLAIIVCIEQYLTHLFEVAARGFPELRSLAAHTLESLAESEGALRESESPSTEAILAIDNVTAWIERTSAKKTEASAALRRLIADCDRCFAFYDSVVKSTQDESVMLMAQRHSATAMQRIAQLHTVEGLLAEPG